MSEPLRDESNYGVDVDLEYGEVTVRITEYECLHPCLMAELHFTPQRAIQFAALLLQAVNRGMGWKWEKYMNLKSFIKIWVLVMWMRLTLEKQEINETEMAWFKISNNLQEW